MKLHVVINPTAGQDQPVLAILSRTFAQHEVSWSPWVTTPEVSATELTRRALEEGADAVAVYGGDGTVSEVASVLVGGMVPMAILPGGTGNVVAQELGIPRELEQAAELAAGAVARELRSLDSLAVGERSYLLRVGIGGDARMVQEAGRERKDRLGWAAYLFSALEQVREPHFAEYRIQIDGRSLLTRAVTCVLANIGRIGRGGLSLAPEIDPCDGFLDLLLIREAGPLALASFGSSILGLAQNDPDGDGPLLHLRAREVEVVTEPQEVVHGDGDPFEARAVHVRLVPGSLPIWVPAASE